MINKIVTLVLLLSGSLFAGRSIDSQIADFESQQIVRMHYLGSLQSPGFFVFDIDGVVTLTLCDQFNPAVTTEPYLAVVVKLDDLTGSFLQRQGDPEALQKYQWLGILASLVYYENPALAPDVTRAMRYIVDGHGALTSPALDLLNWVMTQNPADYSDRLSHFMILSPAVAPGNPVTQEQVFYMVVPEPATFLLFGAGLIAVGLSRRFRGRKER